MKALALRWASLGLSMAVPAVMAAPLASITVKPISPAPSKTKARPDPDPRFWLSAMAGLSVADHADLKTTGFGIYGAGDDLVVGIRARFSEGFGSVRHGRETALLVGGLIGSRQRAWWALGFSSFELERRGDRPDNTYQRRVVGLPLEVVYAPHGKLLGAELRAEADLNSAYPQITLGLAFSLGSR